MINSLANNRVKRVRALCAKPKARREEGVFIAEGMKMFLEAPRSWLEEVYVSDSFYNKYRSNKDKNDKNDSLQGIDYELVSDEVFSKMSDTQTPQGILSVIKQPRYDLEKTLGASRGENPLFVILEDIQDPGNLGTILRVCEGAGVDGVIMSKNTVDIFNPKVVRSTMGSIYRVPFFTVDNLGGAIELLKNAGISVYAAAADGDGGDSCEYDLADYTKPAAFLIGNEGNGLKPATMELASQSISIPMEGLVESLNAAIATAVLVYEAARVRRRGK